MKVEQYTTNNGVVQAELCERVRGAANFLIKFDWEKYKELRATLVTVKHKSDDMVANAALQKLINDARPDIQEATPAKE